MLCVFFASLVATITLYKKKQFYLKPTLALSIPAIIVSLLTYHYIVRQPWFTIDRYNYIIIALILYMILKVFIESIIRQHASKSCTEVALIKLSFAGMAGGFIAALSGFGGGVIMIPIMNGIFKIEFKQAKSISLATIAVTSFALSIYNLLRISITDQLHHNIGAIVIPVVITLIIGVSIGTPFALKQSSKIPSKTLTIIFVISMLMLILYKLLFHTRA